MKKMIAYSVQDVENIVALLNGISVQGIKNCKNITVIAQILDSGIPVEVPESRQSEKKEGEGHGVSTVSHFKELDESSEPKDGS